MSLLTNAQLDPDYGRVIDLFKHPDALDRESAPPTLGAPAPSLDDLVKHALKFGPGQVMETAEVYLTPEQLVTLAARVNQVIDMAAKSKRDGEAREVISYRARIGEARAHQTQKHWLERLNAPQPKGDEVDPRVTMTLELAEKGEKTSIISSRVGRSPDWVRKTIKASADSSEAIAA